METKTELLPCPFCGGVAGKTTDPIGYGEAHCIIACTQCDCCVNVSDPDFNVVERKAADAWNTRVYPAEVQAAIERDIPVQPKLITATREDFDDTFECPSCAKRFSSFDEFDFCPWCGQRLDWSEE